MSTDRRWRAPDFVFTPLALAGMAFLAVPLVFAVSAYMTFTSLEAEPSPYPKEVLDSVAIHWSAWVTVLCLMFGSLLVTLAHALSQRPLAAMVLQIGAALTGAILIGIEAYRYTRFFIIEQSIVFHIIGNAMGYHGYALMAVMILLGISALMALVRRNSPTTESAIWFWHAIDTVWITLIYVAALTGSLPYL